MMKMQARILAPLRPSWRNWANERGPTEECGMGNEITRWQRRARFRPTIAMCEEAAMVPPLAAGNLCGPLMRYKARRSSKLTGTCASLFDEAGRASERARAPENGNNLISIS